MKIKLLLILLVFFTFFKPNVALGEPQYFNTQDILVRLSAKDNEGGSGVAWMQLSFDIEGEWMAVEPFATTKELTVPEGDGNKTIFARFADEKLNWSEVCSATFILDQTPPTGTITIEMVVTVTVVVPSK